MILNIVHVNSLIISCLLLGFGNRTKGDSSLVCFKFAGRHSWYSEPWFHETNDILLYLVESPMSLLSPG